MTAEQPELITIDFETYYDSDHTLSKMSTTEYVFSPQFEVIGVGLRRGNTRVWLEESQFRALVPQLPWHRIILLAHHAHFDGLVLSHHYGARPAFWLDTLSMARAIHGEAEAADLGSLMKKYQVGFKGFEVVAAKGKHRADFTPDEWKQYGVYCKGDCDGTFDIYQKMKVGFPASELELIDTTVRMYTEPTLVLDEPKMQEYLAWEIARKEELLSKISADKSHLSSNNKFAALLVNMGIEPPMKDSPTVKNPDGSPKRIFAFSKTDPAFQELLMGGDEDTRLLCEARLGTKSAGNETRSVRLLTMGANQRALPVYLKYSGAHTHRWSGADKMNWQNFERMNKKNPRKGTIRKSIRAPKGMVLVGGDAAQIEARFNAWYSGETAIVEAFRRNEDIYSMFATLIYNRHIDRKNNADDEIPGHVGKTAVLGLGFGMGHLKFGAEMLKGANGGAPVQFVEDDLHKLGIDPTPFLANPRNVDAIRELPSRLGLAQKLVHYTVANYIVNVYRNKNQKIVGNWAGMKGVIELMAQGYRGPIGKNDIITLVEDGILLPSGLVMHYRELRLSKDEDGRGESYSYYSKRGCRSRIYGGLLTENLTQACCRIIVSDALLKLKREGLKIVTMEHDYIGGICPREEGPHWLGQLLKHISTPPSWAAGLPLSAEGNFGETLGETK